MWLLRLYDSCTWHSRLWRIGLSGHIESNDSKLGFRNTYSQATSSWAFGTHILLSSCTWLMYMIFEASEDSAFEMYIVSIQYEFDMSHARLSRLWRVGLSGCMLSHVTHSCHIWLIRYYVNESCHTWLLHVTFEALEDWPFEMHIESCHILISHMTHSMLADVLFIAVKEGPRALHLGCLDFLF